MKKPEQKSFVVSKRNGAKHVWLTSRLWTSSKDLSIFDFEIATFDCFDEDIWFVGQHKPTVNRVLEHYRRIEKASFEYPIIFSQDGSIFDGAHRICKAHLEGRKTISAVKFLTDPEPDRIFSLSEKISLTWMDEPLEV